MAFTQVTITQDFNLADGTEPSGSVTFTPSNPMRNGAAVVPAVPAVARLDGAGTITIPLAANTDPGTVPAGAYYRVDELINGVTRTYNIQVPHDQGSTLTLYSLAQVATSPGLSFPPQPPLANPSDKILYVSPGGSDTYDGLSWAFAKATLAGAISALTSGGVIEVAGSHTVSSALPQPADHTLIRGSGTKAQITYTGSGSMLTLTAARQVHFQSLRFTLSAAAASSTLFNLSNTFRCSWTNCLIDGQYVGGASTYYGQVGFQFRGNAGDNRVINCDLNNLGEAIQSDTIMNYMVGCVVGNCYTGIHVDAGSSTGGFAVDNSTFVATAIGPSNCRAHILIDVPGNQTWVTNSWFEGSLIAIQAGKNTATIGGPVGMVIANCRLAATTTCLDIRAGRQFRLDNIRFATDSGATPTELTIDATNAVDGFASGLISTAGFDIARATFPSTWIFLPRYTSDAQLTGPTMHIGVNTSSGNPSYVQTGNGRARIGYDGSRTIVSDAAGNRDVALVSGSSTRQVVLDPNGVFYVGAKTQGTADAGGCVVGIRIQNASSLPTTNPTGGGVLYVNAGALTYRGPNGTVTVIAPA